MNGHLKKIHYWPSRILEQRFDKHLLSLSRSCHS